MKLTVITTGALLCAGNLFAGFTEEYQAAARLRPAKAAPKLEALAKTLSNKKIAAREKALYKAGLCYITAKKYPEVKKNILPKLSGATQKALKIALLYAERDYSGVITEFGPENISAWPDPLQYEAYRIRGRCYLHRSMLEKALQDFTKGEKLTYVPWQKAVMMVRKADTLQRMKKTNQALAEYQKVGNMKVLRSRGIRCSSLVQAAKLLTAEKKYNEALAELAKIPKRKSGYWSYVPLQEEARVLRAMGKNAEADAKQAAADKLKGK